ncbi:sigma-70 family RNA polymerase sigma factor [Galbibacter mesophilus]|uniref:sigma-70 family RNA polymerase sigma factor n=1 Tax=Galbibacter mesophilus TaxID=379069 RepID=UPI00191E4E32|nr:sigma-70 family RNA polymerase sigma factor [Galbibacter mesophilus]MCM5661430.1 sigma-70 family RNA polymerase sigma factor [Galbibacter mesophilus]
METQQIWNELNDELYFFILKKMKDKHASNDVFQNTFVKIHRNLSTLENTEKARAWAFQIARNEIANHFKKEAMYVEKSNEGKETPPENQAHLCCFDSFINDLPKVYREVIELVYIKGEKQKDAAIFLNISLENVKARVRRAKEILKQKLSECCQYEFDKNGKLIGEPNCVKCNTGTKMEWG